MPVEKLYPQLSEGEASVKYARRPPRTLQDLLQSVGLGLVTLWLVSVVTFALTDLSGGDVARLDLGRFATQAQVDLFRHQQGLDQPPLTRYWVWIDHTVRGDWGISVATHARTSDLVLPRAARSMLLGLVSLLVALPLAFGVGLVAGQRPGGVVDNFLSTGILFVLGLPSFVVGLVVIYIFAAWLRLLPPDSTGLDIGSTSQQVEAFILPVMTLSIILTPYIARMVRSNVREVLATPYIQSALMRGVKGWRLFANHVVPNALGPAINVVALSLAEVLTGVVVVENVFGFPGLGQLTVAAIGTEDIAVLQICVLLAAIGFVTLNLVADAMVIGLNPRLRRRQA